MKERERLCVSCRTLKPREQLLRLTYSNKEELFSLEGRPLLQGRSAYVCREEACLEAALKARKLQRALKRVVPDDILKYLSRELEGLKISGSS